MKISAQFMRLWKSTVGIKNICLGKVVISLEAQKVAQERRQNEEISAVKRENLTAYLLWVWPVM